MQVVVIHTLHEKMLYDLKYFVVQSGKPVQIVLDNGDAMPHNVVVTQPGTGQSVAAAGAPLSDKNYVPDDKNIIQASPPADVGQAVVVNFVAPEKPGAYDFVCTFPGHSIRMYGVMDVVKDIEAYDKDPKPPVDPLTKKPFDSQKNDADAPPPPAGHEH